MFFCTHTTSSRIYVLLLLSLFLSLLDNLYSHFRSEVNLTFVVYATSSTDFGIFPIHLLCTAPGFFFCLYFVLSSVLHSSYVPRLSFLLYPSRPSRSYSKFSGAFSVITRGMRAFICAGLVGWILVGSHAYSHFSRGPLDISQL